MLAYFDAADNDFGDGLTDHQPTTHSATVLAARGTLRGCTLLSPWLAPPLRSPLPRLATR